MKHSLKIMTAVAVGFVGLVGATTAEAVNPAQISVTVTIQRLSVTVTDGTAEFGTVALASNTVSAVPQNVTNDGNVAETYTLQLTAVDLLTAGTTETSAGPNFFVLQAVFTGDAGAAPASADFGADAGTADDVVLTGGPQTASATTYAWATNTGDGVSVPVGTELDLYFKYSAPTSDSVTNGVQEDLQVTLTAQAG